MIFLLRQVAIAVCFASLAFCGTARHDAVNLSIFGAAKDGSELCPLTNPRLSVYVPHPKDCSKFFICENGVPHLRTCQSGLHFNPSLKACDYPESAGCDKSALKKPKERMIGDDLDSCPLVNPRFPVLLPHSEDCGKFYICDSGSRHLKECQSGLHFNPKIKACDFPENAGCDRGVTEKPKGRIIDDDLDSCPVENSRFPVLLPHPEDCNKFYICDSGSRHQKKCQSGLHFNPKIKACDYPENAGCDTGTTEKPKGRIIDDGLDSCPDVNSKFPVLLPHPEDCSKFYICDSGSRHLKKCQPGLHFNPKIKACDYPEKAGCDSGEAEEPKGRMIGDDLDLCPAENTKYPVLLPHPEDCSKFYMCDSGSARLKACQSGLHFNPKIKACDYPEKAGCDAGFEDEDKPVGRMVDDDNSCPVQSSGLPVFFPHPTECSTFFICNEGAKFPFVCPSGLHFNPKRDICDFPDSAECDESFKGVSEKPKEKSLESKFSQTCPVENPSDHPVLLSHPTECDMFFLCDHGKPILKYCPPGLNFNEELQACDYAENTICDRQMTDRMAGVPSPFCPLRNGKIPIFYRHPTNCSVYYMCGNGLAYEFVCPARLHFNVRKKVCDYEHDAGCRR